MPQVGRHIKYSPSARRGIARLKGGWNGAISAKRPEIAMRRIVLAVSALAAVAVMAAGCQDKIDPSKPRVIAIAVQQAG